MPDNEILFVDAKKEVKLNDEHAHGLLIAFKELHASPL